MLFNFIENKKKYRFDIKIKSEYLDISKLRILYSQLMVLKSSIKKFKKDDIEHEYIRGLIRIIKAEIKCYSFMCYVLTVKLGNHYMYQKFLEFPTKENIKDLMSKVKVSLSNKRQKQNKVIKEDKILSGLKYTTVGGVFQQNNTIVELNNKVNNLNRIKTRKTPHEKIKQPYLGIELEVITKTNKTNIENIMIANKLAGHVFLEHDGSIETEQDGEDPQEITVLVKQDDHINVIRNICSLLKENPINAYVNPSCGMHVHFDVRNRDASLVYKNLVHMLPLLNQLVPRSRVVGQWADKYCMQNPYDNIEKAQTVVTKHPNGKARYQAINPMYEKYKTIEVRLHGGTINATKIISWIQVCLFAVESKKEIPFIYTMEDLLSHFKVTQGLVKFLEERIKLFKENPDGLDVRADHFFFSKESL